MPRKPGYTLTPGFRDTRWKADLTQAQLAELACVSRQTIVHAERGAQRVSEKTARCLAEAMGYTLRGMIRMGAIVAPNGKGGESL